MELNELFDQYPHMFNFGHSNFTTLKALHSFEVKRACKARFTQSVSLSKGLKTRWLDSSEHLVELTQK